MEKILKNLLICVLLAALGLMSFFVLGGWSSNPETYRGQIDSIDNKVDTVLMLTSSSTLLSAAVSALPGDTATPIADKLADVTEYFLFILCALYAEKYLMTILGAGLFKVLIPLSCLLCIAGQFFRPERLRHIAMRLTLLGIALFIAIPVGLHVSDMIYDTYRGTIEQTVSDSEALTDESEKLSGEAEDQGVISSVLSRVSETTEKAADILKRFIETLAVLIVTSCVIPVLILLFFLWVIKIVTGTNLAVRDPLTSGAARAGDPSHRYP